MNKLLVSCQICTALASLAAAQNRAISEAPLREVRGQTIISKELPAAELTFGDDFHHVGGQRVNLYGNADVEQQLFVKAGNGGVVERFYRVQFEHFLPTNKYAYTYPADRTTEAEDPASDGAAISRLLTQDNLVFPSRAAAFARFTCQRRTAALNS